MTPRKGKQAPKPSKAEKSAKPAKSSEPAKPSKSSKSSKPSKAAKLSKTLEGTEGSRTPPKRSEGGQAPGAAAQRLYDMPYSAVAPRLVNPGLGLHNLVARAGHNAAYTIDVTLLDAPDHRLIRSGVLLAHRVLDGRGEWYLTAPDWQPLLPQDRIELMGHSDLPEELADLVRPFRRRAPVGPVAALSCDRREFALRDDRGATRALLRDDKVTVRRGGLTTARYREVMITPVGEGLDEEQTGWLDRALTGVGSTFVPRFPQLASRLGAPATGPSDLPGPAGPDAGSSFKRLLGQLVGQRLRQVVEADLAVRGGDAAAAGRLVEQARGLATELDGLAVGIEADWLGDLADELGWLVGEDGERPERLASRLRSERYLALLDLLVSASRAPRLGERSTVPAAVELERLLSTALDQLSAAVERAASLDSGPVWDQVARSLTRAEAVAALAEPVLPAAADVRRRLRKPRLRLDALVRPPLDEPAAAAGAGLEPPAAFAAGRAWEQQVGQARRSRQGFLDAWRRSAGKLGARAGPG